MEYALLISLILISRKKSIIAQIKSLLINGLLGTVVTIFRCLTCTTSSSEDFSHQHGSQHRWLSVGIKHCMHTVTSTFTTEGTSPCPRHNSSSAPTLASRRRGNNVPANIVGHPTFSQKSLDTCPFLSALNVNIFVNTRILNPLAWYNINRT